MSELETCDSCTKSEPVWVTLLDNSVMCVSDLIEWGGCFRKYVTEYIECHEDESHTNTAAYIIGAVSAALILIAGGSILWLQKQRREQNRFKLIPYKRLGEEELADNLSIATEVSIISDLENRPSTSAASRLSQQKSSAEVGHEQSVADMLKLEDAVSTTPKSELKVEANYEEEEAAADAESEAQARIRTNTGADTGAGARNAAVTGAEIGATVVANTGAGVKAEAQVKIEDSDGDANEDYNDEVFYDSSSDISLDGEETEVDEEFEAAAAAGKLMEHWQKNIKKEF